MENLIFPIILLGALYYTCNRFNYWINVVIYTIYEFFCLAFADPPYQGTLFIAILSSFIVSLIYIKMLNIVNNHTNGPIWFIVIALIAGIVLDFVMGIILATLGLIVSL